MKIDAVLARHPWPWRSCGGNAWAWLDAKGRPISMFDPDMELALLTLVAAHVASKAKEEEAKP